MPQPLPNVRRGANAIMSGGLVIENRPDLALKMMQVMMAWAEVESFVGQIMASSFGEEALDAINEAIGCPNATGQREILMRRARTKFDQEQIDDLTALMEQYKSAQKGRNKIAHWSPGFSPEVPDSVLLLDPKHMWRQAEAFSRFVREGGGTQMAPPSPKAILSKALVFFMRDFEEMLADIAALRQAFGLINFLLIGGAVAVGARDQLHSIPQFQTGKNSLSERP